MKRLSSILLLFLALTLNLFAGAKELRQLAKKQQKQSDYKDALTSYKKLLIDHNDHQSGQDLSAAIHCLYNLNFRNQTDELVESTLAKRPKNFTIHRSAASYYLNTSHYGAFIDGKFERHSNSRAQRVSSLNRDRVRALQLYAQAETLINLEDAFFTKSQLGNFTKFTLNPISKGTNPISYKI